MPPRTIGFRLSGPLFDNQNLGDQIVSRNSLSIMHQILDGTALSRMRNRIPVQTGNLKKSLRIAYSPAEGSCHSLDLHQGVFTGASRAGCVTIFTTLPLGVVRDERASRP